MGCTCEDDDPPAPIVINAPASAAAQADWNQDAAEKTRAMNMVNQYTPEGSSVWGPTGEQISGIDMMGVTQTMSPEQQSLFDSANRMKQGYADFGESQMGDVQDIYGTAFDYGQFGPAPTLDETSRAVARANIIARNQPQMDQAQQAFETKMATQGIQAGSGAYDDEYANLARRQNDFYLGADAAAGNEMAQRYGLDINARNQAINEALNARNLPMSEMSTFMSGSQPVKPSFLSTPTTTVTAPNQAGLEVANMNAQNMYNMNSYAQQQANNRANTQGLYSLLGAGAENLKYSGAQGFGWSDRRLKTNIAKVGALASGLAVYSFNYVWSNVQLIGVMADEAVEIFPQAVRYVDGFAQVNYAEIS